MYELTVQREFCAAHAILIRGTREPVHGHTWRVEVSVRGDQVDSDGLLCDFHDLEKQVDHAISPLHNRDLNATPPFDRVNPTAERVAEHIANCIRASLPSGVTLSWVRVMEAPGCLATFRENAS